MKLTIHLKGQATRTTDKFKSEQSFKNSEYFRAGWRIQSEPSPELKAIVNEVPVQEDPPDTMEAESPNEETKTIEQIRIDYKAATGNEVPNRYKNNVTWLLSKINENPK